LIDYFHDMSLLRNNTDNSINFQRASCTLDGCVKIWTSRVDSVGTETGKLLSNLASEGRAIDDDEPTSDNPDAQDPSQPKKKKNQRAGATLAKDLSQLRNKKLDLEFSVDPLFKKTCADFDEGGAHGLLMNHLSLGVGTDGGMRVVFDASDSVGIVAEEETEEPEDLVDLSVLRGISVAGLNIKTRLIVSFAEKFLPDLDVLENRAISHSLASFSFSKDAFVLDEPTFRDDTGLYNDDYDDNEDFAAGGDNGPPMDVDGAAPPAEDFFQGDQAVTDDFGGGPDDYGGDHASAGSVGDDADQAGPAGRPGPLAPFDPRRVPNERELVMAMTEADEEGGMMDYFDQNFLKNWAGPEHWKLRKVVRKRMSIAFKSPLTSHGQSNFRYSGSRRGQSRESSQRKERGLQDRFSQSPRKGPQRNCQGTFRAGHKGSRDQSTRNRCRCKDPKIQKSPGEGEGEEGRPSFTR
jgi:condensin complex subunit 2